MSLADHLVERHGMSRRSVDELEGTGWMDDVHAYAHAHGEPDHEEAER